MKAFPSMVERATSGKDHFSQSSRALLLLFLALHPESIPRPSHTYLLALERDPRGIASHPICSQRSGGDCLAHSLCTRTRQKVVCRRTLAIMKNKYAHLSKAKDNPDALLFNRICDEIESGESSASPEDQEGGSGVRSASPSNATRERGIFEYPDTGDIDPNDPSTFGFLEVGIVGKPHGFKGELRVKSDSHFAKERLCRPGPIFLKLPKRRAPRESMILHGRKGPGKNNFLVKLDNLANSQEAAKLRGAKLFARREMRPSLAVDDLMLWEYEGFEVFLAERAREDSPTNRSGQAHWIVGSPVGVITGVIPAEELTGNPNLGNDLLVITLGGVASMIGSDDDSGDLGDDFENGEEGDTVFVPSVKEIVVEIRPNERVMLIDPPAGLLDIIQPKKEKPVVIKGLLPPAS